MTTLIDGPDAVRAAEGTHLGYSDWLKIEQDRVNMFADATGDHQWIHVDPERAKDGPFGAAIAHGYLTMSLSNFFCHRSLKFKASPPASITASTRFASRHRSRSAKACAPGLNWLR